MSVAISQIDMYTEKKIKDIQPSRTHTQTCAHTHTNAGKVLDLNFQRLAPGRHGALKERRLVS